MKLFIFLITLPLFVYAQDFRSLGSNNFLLLQQRLSARGVCSTKDYFNRNIAVDFIKRDLQLKNLMSAELQNSELSYVGFIHKKYSFDIFGEFNQFNTSVEKPFSVISDTSHNIFYSESGEDYTYFMNGIVETDFSTDVSSLNNSAYLRAGLILGGEVGNFNFYFYATNGTVRGAKGNYSRLSAFKQNYKYNEKPESSFFDETLGFVSYSTQNIEVKLGRDFTTFGYSSNFPLLDNSGLPLDHFSINLRTNRFSYSHLHAKILDRISTTVDTIMGPINKSVEKHLAFHRFSIRLFENLVLGLGEFIVYSDRGLDLSYLNPFSFYKSVEHANRDRDNSILFLDIFFNTKNGLQPYAVILLDDIDFSKIGTGWWGNQTLLNAGFWEFTSLSGMPVYINADWVRVEPYVFTHRINRNNFTNFGESLAGSIKPNSENYAVTGGIQITPRTELILGVSYTNHWNNTVDSSGKIVFNSGGDVNSGKRLSDSDIIRFREGELNVSNKARAELNWEFVLNFRMTFGIDYERLKSKNYTSEEFFNYIKLLVKF